MNIQTALVLLQQHWQMSGTASELPSYADHNFKIQNEQGVFVLKIANPNWSYDDLDFENAALLHLEQSVPELALPSVQLACDGRHIIPIKTQQEQLCHMRLMRFVAGDVYATMAARQDINQARLQKSLGLAMAKIALGLHHFKHPNMHRYVDWNISNLAQLCPEIQHINHPRLADLLTRHTNYFLAHEKSWQQSLPMQVIHNDANDYNVIVSSPVDDVPIEVNGFIDFGDMCYQFRVFDLAIAITYALQHVEQDQDVLSTLLRIISHYHTITPLSSAELQALMPCILARLCQSILMASIAQRRDPDNQYILISQKGVRRLLVQLDTISGGLNLNQISTQEP
ncbi:MAG: phosphotransferase [Undibacterium sp.]|nr:phosphotransferase [Undibacterium sp.]